MNFCLQKELSCDFIPSPVREDSTLFEDHRGSILANRAETSQEG